MRLVHARLLAFNSGELSWGSLLCPSVLTLKYDSNRLRHGGAVYGDGDLGPTFSRPTHYAGYQLFTAQDADRSLYQQLFSVSA